MKRIAVVLLLAVTCLAAPPIDLTGEWRFQEGDDIRWAEPGFDDSAWPLVVLPFAATPTGPYWLRRTVHADASIGNPVIVIGSLAAYQVFADGIAVGKTDDDGRRPSPPAIFALPRIQGSKVSIAVRAFRAEGVVRNLAGRLRDAGPYLLTERWHAEEAIATSRLQRQRAVTPSLLATYTQFAFGILLMFSWLTNRRQPELIWFGLFIFTAGLANLDQLLRVYNGVGVAYPRLLLLVLWVFLNEALGILFGRRFPLVWTAVSSPWSLISVSFLPLALAPTIWWAVSACLRGSREQRWLGIAVLTYATPIVSSVLPGTSLQQFYAGPFQIFITPWISASFGVAVMVLLVRRARADRKEQYRLAAELDAARSMQQMLLAPSGDSGYVVETVYHPAQEVGGDFYWTRSEPGGGLLVIVGDVSGKGLRAAMLVSVAVGILRNEKSSSPASILRALTEGLTGHTSGGFVTCCCARFDGDGAVTIASAGHVAPYADGHELQIEPGLPLGIAADATYTETTATGRRFVFVSDGVVEAATPGGELFGFDRTREISGGSAQEIADVAKAWGQNDDITVVTVRRAK